jgi:hypothetical protein
VGLGNRRQPPGDGRRPAGLGQHHHIEGDGLGLRGQGLVPAAQAPIRKMLPVGAVGAQRRRRLGGPHIGSRLFGQPVFGKVGVVNCLRRDKISPFRIVLLAPTLLLNSHVPPRSGSAGDTAALLPFLPLFYHFTALASENVLFSEARRGHCTKRQESYANGFGLRSCQSR